MPNTSNNVWNSKRKVEVVAVSNGEIPSRATLKQSVPFCVALVVKSLALSSGLLRKLTCCSICLPKQPVEKQVLAPHHTVDWLVRGVAQRADRIALGHRLGAALKALTSALHVYRHLAGHRGVVGDIGSIDSSVKLEL